MITSEKDSIFKYAVRRSGSAVAYCALTIKCGTRYETDCPDGTAHFLEHTLFKGTEKKSAHTINNYLDRLGGELNAFTTKEEIVLHATVLKEDLLKAANLLFELATCPTFPKNEIDTEKGVVIDEINSYKDSPSEDIYDRFEELCFEGHPLSKLILGTAKSVRKMTSKSLRAYVDEMFIPENMAFTVVADIDEKVMERKVLKLIEKYFPNIEEKKTISAKPVYFKPDMKRFDKTVNQRNHQVNCIIGAPAPSIYEREGRFKAILLTNILGGPANNSLLNEILREKNGWVYGVECSYNQYSDCGLITISLGCDKDNLEKCLDKIKLIIANLESKPLSDRKLNEAKKQLLGQLAISYDNGEALCLSMGKNLVTFGSIEESAVTRQEILDITAEQLQQAAREIFDKDKVSMLTYL